MDTFRTIRTYGTALLIVGLIGWCYARPARADGPAFVPYVGVHGGYSIGSTEVGISGSPLAIDGLSSHGLAGGIHAGLDTQLPGTQLVLGVFADYTWQDVAFEVKPNLLKATLGDSWTVGGRAGIQMGNALPYVLVGYTGTKSDTSFAGTSIASPDLRGWTGGAGIELKLSSMLSLAGEYRYTKYDSENLFGVVDLQTESHSVMARLNVRLQDAAAAMK